MKAIELIKIRGNNIEFAGCLNYRLNKRNVDLTKKHYEYESDCRNVCIEIAKFFCGQLTRNVIK